MHTQAWLSLALGGNQGSNQITKQQCSKSAFGTKQKTVTTVSKLINTIYILRPPKHTEADDCSICTEFSDAGPPPSLTCALMMVT